MKDAAERRQQVSEEAAEWLLHLQSGDLSAEQRARFVDWLRESPLHVNEMLRVGQMQVMLREFDGWNEVAPLAAQPASTVIALRSDRERPQAGSAPRRSRWQLPAALAAAVAIVAVAVWSTGVFAWERVQTRLAERRELTLADGSVVQLAPDSSLRIRLEPRLRRIVLSRGEAFFRVARDARRPFVVETGYASVRATGTAFAVERRGEAAVVTVTEGSVSVRRTRPALNPYADAIPAGTPAYAVAAGEQLVAPRAGAFTAAHVVDTTRELAWTVGHLIFDHDRVQDAADRFNRYNRTQIRIADEAIGSLRVSGVFDTSDPQSFVSFMESVFAVRAERTADGQIVVESAAH